MTAPSWDVSPAEVIRRCRSLLAFGLATAEAEDVGLYNIGVGSRGLSLSIYLDRDGDTAAVDRMAAALGIEVRVVKRADSTYTVGSKRPRPPWAKPDDPEPEWYGPSVPFGGELVEITVTCSLSRVL